MDAPAAGARTLTKGEEIANSLTHGAGLLASLVAFPFLVVAASRRWGAPEVVGAAVFASSLVALYLVSTLYHAVRPSRAKQVLQKLDHTAIYLLIAGSYTPFTLGVLRGPWGWTLLSLVWAIAGTGIGLEFAFGKKVHRLAVGLYVLMGWLVVVAAKPLLAAVPGRASPGSRPAGSSTPAASGSTRRSGSATRTRSGTSSSSPGAPATSWRSSAGPVAPDGGALPRPAGGTRMAP